MSVLVRQLRDAGAWRLLRDVRLAALAESPAAFASNLALEQGFDEATWRERAASGISSVALLDGEAVGLAGVLPEPGAADGELQLVSMWVDPRFRRAGVARALLDAATSVARGRGAHTLTLWVVRDNTAAVRAYERYGFEPVQVPAGVADHTCAGEQRMALSLA